MSDRPTEDLFLKLSKEQAQKVADLVQISCRVLSAAPWRRMPPLLFDTETGVATSFRDDFEKAIRDAASVLGWTIEERKPPPEKAKRRKTKVTEGQA